MHWQLTNQVFGKHYRGSTDDKLVTMEHLFNMGVIASYSTYGPDDKFVIVTKLSVEQVRCATVLLLTCYAHAVLVPLQVQLC